MGSRTKGDIVLIEFDYTQDFDTIDYRKNPEMYIIGRGEQGVLLVEPYKSEIWFGVSLLGLIWHASSL